MMNKNLQSPTKLTEFAPLQPEERQQGVAQLLCKFFSRFQSGQQEQPATTVVQCEGDNVSQEALPSWAIDKDGGDVQKDAVVYPVDVAEGRSLPNVLKRISNLLALKSNNLQAYSDSELKQYWMPDSVSKECYECCEKFTTFRRRHHCRVCGQIFCSSCCNQQIPGRIFGCTGDLRVCTYCCKVVVSYLESSDTAYELTEELKTIQENLAVRSGTATSTTLPREGVVSPNAISVESLEPGSAIKRKISVGYQEEKFAPRRSSVSYLTSEEKCRALQNSTSLRNLYEEICRPNTGVPLRTHKCRLRTYSGCLWGSDLVDWLIYQQKANSRIQAAAIGRALLEGGYIVCLSDANSFVDGYTLYKLGNVASPEVPTDIRSYESGNQDEPSWVQSLPQESSTTDSENEQLSPPTSQGHIPSSSSYTLDLNVSASTVYLSRPPASSVNSEESDSDLERHKDGAPNESPMVRTSEQRELVPESGWHNATTHLRDENQEKLAYNLLKSTFAQHESSLLKQLLSVDGVSQYWSDVVLPLVHEAVDLIRPDVNHDAEELDVRNYVKFKKISGGSRSNCELIRGIVCSKNVTHKGMPTKLDNPKILLLEGSIVYQRKEARLMSLEPVIMQEHECLRNVAARIIAFRPDVVLIQKNVSRLAQDILREQGVTLVINVKRKVLERIARCTQADLVASIDAHIGRPRLGTCKKFHLKSFECENGESKTLMFFEGLPNQHLGATILLRGTSKDELVQLKSVTSLLLFACYNWRLEKSFLMDEFAFPPYSKDEFFYDSKENSPTEHEHKFKKIRSNDELFGSENDTDFFVSSAPASELRQTKTTVNERRHITERVDKDFVDPLHSDDVFRESDTEKLAVAELPFSNHFRKALDDTILCISPYLVFSVPYLETETGRRCRLRRFFPTQIYHSVHFECKATKKGAKRSSAVEDVAKMNRLNLKPPHEFVTARISTSVDSVEVQTLLAHYRACGGRLVKKPLLECKAVDDDERNDNKHGYDPDTVDVLDPRNHQRMAVLFCSFSHESSNAPAFCVNPWVVYMDFYGNNDIPLGCFLERYCFRPTYTCQSKCGTPMSKHVRRFVHYNGCVSIFLNRVETESSEDVVVMWNWCSKCNGVSPIVPMSVDTWSFSFAKYLQLRFHGGIYSRRGSSPCQHSLHHDHIQYFAYKNMVATFKYTSVQLWEISLPPPIIELKYDTLAQQTEMIDEMKTLALKGHDVFSVVGERLAVLPGDEDIVITYKQLLLKEQLVFKQKIEEVQLKLTSPTIENRDCDFNDPNYEVQTAVWRISDALVRIKRMIVDAVDQWNVKLSDAVRKKEDRRKDRVSSHQDLDSPNVSDSRSHLLETSDSESNSTQKEESGSFGVLAGKKNRSLDQCDEEVKISCSPKGHHRSQSDGTVLSQLEDGHDGKKETKTMKNIFSLFSSASLTPIPNPFSNQEHYTLPSGIHAPIVVYESEPSSIIAYALNCYEYRRLYDDLTGTKPASAEQTPSPVHKRRSQGGEKDRSEGSDHGGSSLEKSTGLLSFLRNKDSGKVDNSGSFNSNTESQCGECPPTEKTEDPVKNKNMHVDVQFEDSNCNFFCRVFYAEKFAQLRRTVLPIGEEAYVRSLSRSVQWNARGGKSGSAFCKTTDDRFILKDMTKSEVSLFLYSAHNYFRYMQRCFATGQPTLLGKIVGVYHIIYRNATTNVTGRSYLLVMENLFYNRKVQQKFDLKGSMRNRLVNPDNQDGEIVLLDENLLKMTCESPLYILPHSKSVLTAAIQNDTEFLSTQSVMDYSLLVGLDAENKELVLGIIDYIRTFTWDKKMETIVKKFGGQGKLPTIVPPEEYQKRFIEAMHRYFLEVPDPWAGLGKGLE